MPGATEINSKILRERVERRLPDRCESMDTYIQGSHHLTYKAKMSTFGNIIVRVQFDFSKSSGGSSGTSSPFKMLSEIATMRFLKQHTSIPIPEVYGHDADLDGQVGGEWMMMEYVHGANVDEVWDKLSPTRKEALSLSMADIWCELMSMQFDCIGSLYESNSSQSYVGPMCFLPSKNHYAVAPPDPEKCGPFRSARDWLEATARQQLSYRLSLPPQPNASLRIQKVLDLIRHSEELRTSSILPASSFRLEHVDFSLHNVVLDRDNPTRVAAVLDWEGARVVPMWGMDPVFRWPHGSDELENKHLRSVMRDRITARVPGWGSAIGEECRALRYLYYAAMFSDRDPKIIDPKGYSLFMSHDI